MSSGPGVKGPDPLIKLVIQPQEHVIIPIHSFILLHCEANSTDYTEYEYENDDTHAYHASLPDEGDYMQNDEPNDDSHQQSREGTASYLCQQEVQYQWIRNGKPINDPNNAFTQTFCNGTIKIIHSPMATATYRCVASTINPEIGAIVSKASHVKAAGKMSISLKKKIQFYSNRFYDYNIFFVFTVLQRIFDKLSSKAELSSSVVLNCPIESTPQANIKWTFNNESNINFDTSDR